MKVAIVGSGISGLSAASALAKAGHSVTIFEKSGHVGGHARTTVVDGTPVDVGFQLLNRTTYPNLVHFFEENGIELEPSPLTFSFAFDDTHVPAPTPADLALFEADVLSFLGGASQPEVTLGQFLEGRAYSEEFRSAYLVPLCAGIWLSSKEAILGASARTVLTFLRDHQMLQVSGHLPWMTVKGRSQAYVNKLVSVLESSGVEIRTSVPVSAVERTASGVAITANGSSTVFDKVVMAAHAPDTLALLGDGATSAEKAILRAISYTKSTVVLHRDASLMPADPAAWGAWNFVGSSTGASSTTYWLNKLQNLDDDLAPLFLTINPHTPPTTVLDDDPYLHWGPDMNPGSALALANFGAIQGRNNTWFAGAYQGYGFHEDGFKAGMAAAYDIMGKVYQPINAKAVDAPAVAYKACKPLAVFEGRIAKMEATIA